MTATDTQSITRSPTQSTTAPTKTLRTTRAVQNMWLAMGLIGAAFVATAIALDTRIPAVGTVMTLAILMAVWTRWTAPVRLFDDHVELKTAPLAPLRTVLYRDIREVDILSAKKAKLTYLDGERTTSVRLPLHLLSKQDGSWLLGFLGQRAA